MTLVHTINTPEWRIGNEVINFGLSMIRITFMFLKYTLLLDVLVLDNYVEGYMQDLNVVSRFQRVLAFQSILAFQSNTDIPVHQAFVNHFLILIIAENMADTFIQSYVKRNCPQREVYTFQSSLENNESFTEA